MIEFMWLIVAVGASMLWGLVYVLDKKILETFTVVESLCFYYTFSTIVCWAWILGRGTTGSFVAKTFAPENRNWVIATTLCAFGANLLIGRSIQLSNATVAALVEMSYPVFTVLFSYWLLKTNTLTVDVAIGGALIMAGVGWIALRA